MKKLKCFKIVIIFLILLLGVNLLDSQTMNLKDRYSIGAFNQNKYMYYFKDNALKWQDFRDLNFTFNVSNCVFYWNQPVDPNYNQIMVGGFYDDVNSYISNVGDLFNRSYNNGQSLAVVRSKTMLAAYGQRSTYNNEIDYYCNNT